MMIELLQPVYGSEENAIRSLTAYMDAELKELDVSYQISVQKKRFAVSLEGGDEEICANLLYQTFGKPIKKSEMLIGVDYKGYISKIESDQIFVNVGFDILISSSLEVLGTGSTGQIASRFGMILYLPVTIQLNPDFETASFSKEQADLWWSWKKASTDRVFVNGATRSQVKAVLQRTRHGRDVYGVEKLGLTECVIICKEKTDGPGIVSAIGKRLPSQMGVLIGGKK
jgi:Uncharacterized protein conserved in archaea